MMSEKNIRLILQTLFKQVIDILYESHSILGPGLEKSIYEEQLYIAMLKDGLKVHKQKPLLFLAKEVQLDTEFMFDLIVEDKIFIKIKAIDTVNNIYEENLLTYLRLSGGKIGILTDYTETLHKTYICSAL
jgi:GxxExxY protein